MFEFKKIKKRYNTIAIILLILAGIVLIAGVCIDIFAEMDNTISIILFVVAVALIIIIIPLLVLISKCQSNISKRLIDGLNKALNLDYKYQEGAPILDIIEDSMHPYGKDELAFSQDGICGKYNDIDFEYYLFNFQNDSLLKKSSKMYELYVFKNICVFPKEFFITADKLKNVEDYKIIPLGRASIYTTKNDEVPLDDLPEKISFLSISGQTLYVYKLSDRKKPLFLIADDVEDFKELFAKEIEKIISTYEETKEWTK